MGVIAYTRENYHIEYGVSSDALTMRNEALNGSTNLTSTNLLYSANLTNLRPFTQYYYRLVASNSFTTSQTAVQMFQTSEAGIKNYVKMTTNLDCPFLYCSQHPQHHQICSPL